MRKEETRNNRRNLLCFCFVATLGGIEYGYVVPILFSFLKDGIHTTDGLNIWFGLINSSFFIASIICSLTVAKYMDRTRKIRRVLVGTCLLVSAGNLIYAVSDRAAMVLVGRFMQGFGDFLTPVFYSEITKTFHKEECYRKLSMLSSIFFVTYICSPVIAAIFNTCEFSVFGIHFNVYTIPPFLIAICWLVLGIISWLVVKNSKLITIETDAVSNNRNHNNLLQNENPAESSISKAKLKDKNTFKNKKSNLSEERSVENEILLHSERQYPKKKKTQKMFSFRELVSCPPYQIVLMLSALHAYFMASFMTIYTPMIANQIYNLPLYWMSALFTTAAVMLVLTLFFASKYNLFHKNEYYICMLGLSFVVIVIQLQTLAIILHKYKRMGEVFLALSTTIYGFVMGVDQVLLAGFIGRCIPHSTQSYAANIRRSLFNCCFVIGLLVSPLLVDINLLFHGIAFSILTFLLFIYLMFKKQVFECF